MRDSACGRLAENILGIYFSLRTEKLSTNNSTRKKNRIGSISLAIALAGFAFVAFQPWFDLASVVLVFGLTLKQALLSFFEAALVGGIADWFAISALFRHPLGIHLPHTNIIARKKDSLADAVPRFLGSFVQESAVAAELSKVDFVQKFTAFLDRDEVRETARKWLRERVSASFLDTREDQIKQALKSVFDYLRERVDLVAGVASLLQWAQKEEADERIIEALAEMFVREIDRKHDFLVENLTPLIKKNTGWQGLFISANTVDRFLTSMRDELRAVKRNKQHTLRRFVIESIRDYGKDLSDPSPTKPEKLQLQRFVADAFQNDALLDKSAVFVADIVRRIGSDLSLENSSLISDFTQFIETLRTRLETDTALRDRVNEGVARVLSGFLTQGHLVQAMSTYAADQLKKTETKEFVTRVENAVSNDLQFIRVNGAVVGGLVGLVLAFINALVGGR